MTHGSRPRHPLARPLVGRGIHAPALAEKAAARARRVGRARYRTSTRRICSRWPARDDVESRLVVAQGDRWDDAAGSGSAAFVAATNDGPDGPCWYKARICTTRSRIACSSGSGSCPTARLDDAMLSYASDGGGRRPPHRFVRRVSCCRSRAAVAGGSARCPRPALRDDVPLKMLSGFEPSAEWILEPGDMPLLAARLGSRGRGRRAAVHHLLDRLSRARPGRARGRPVATHRRHARGRHRRAGRGRRRRSMPTRPRTRRRTPRAFPSRSNSSLRVPSSAPLPTPLRGSWRSARSSASRRRGSGSSAGTPAAGSVASPSIAARACCMTTVTSSSNGEAFRSGGGDARLMRRFADRRRLAAVDVARLSGEARALLRRWIEAGWCEVDNGVEP